MQRNSFVTVSISAYEITSILSWSCIIQACKPKTEQLASAYVEIMFVFVKCSRCSNEIYSHLSEY